MRPYRNRSALRLQHCSPGNAFFEIEQSSSLGAPFFHRASEEWESIRFGPWLTLRPRDTDTLPAQGWKIHISARPQDADEVLGIAGDVCMQNHTPFKHLANTGEFRRANMKYSDRASAGKFITVFPSNEEEFCALLQAFDAALGGFEGPYILSDVRYGSGPVFFRYGGFFLERFGEEDGETGFAIRDPDGTKIQDVRDAVFSLPSFVEPPALIKELVHNRLAPDPGELGRLLHPYVVRSGLHFSSAGGVYLADDPSNGQSVVLKEARRWSAYSSATADATERLRNERRALDALTHVDAVVNLIEYRVVGDHEFLVEEHIPGLTLQSWAASNYPFSTDPAVIAGYSESATALAEQLVAAVEQVHAAGWALLDLQPKNILVDRGLVRLIDLEAARRLGESPAGSVGTPGFVPHAKSTNRDRDRYALAAVVLHLFWPSLAGAFEPAVIRHRRNKVAEHFPPGIVGLIDALVTALPEDTLTTTHGFRHATDVSREHANGALITQLCVGVEQTRDPDPDTLRRYPGDATQFTNGPGAMLDIETGAAGVALMLSRAGRDIRSDVSWIARRLEAAQDAPFHGLLRGTVGIAAVLAQLGEIAEAERTILADTGHETGRNLSIRSGLAGTVLALCDVAALAGPGPVLHELRRHAARLASHITDDGPIHSPHSETGNAVGLFDGWSGVGLVCRRLAEITGDRAWDGRMGVCFKRELAQLVESDEGHLRVDYGSVSYGYLSEGAAGIAFALAQCAPARFEQEISRLTKSFDGIISLNGGLFRGTAGVAVATLPVNSSETIEEQRRLMQFTEESFLFHRADQDGLMFLGDNGYHLSSDYSTGAAGFIGSLLSHQEGNPSLWFPSMLPSPVREHVEGGEHNERIAFSAEPVQRLRR